MIRVVVVRHDPIVPQGYLEAVLPATTTEVRLDRGERLPELGAVDALVVLGGTMGVYDEERFPFLAAEQDYLRQAVAAGLPVLGICLGCQLLAAALGGAAYRAPRLEARFAPCDLTEAGSADPVVRHLARPVLSLHEDTWEPPPGGAALSFTDRYPQAFRHGSALGIQPHPEAPPEVAASWVDALGSERFAAVGVDPQALLAEMRRRRGESEDLARRLFGAWLGGGLTDTPRRGIGGPRP